MRTYRVAALAVMAVLVTGAAECQARSGPGNQNACTTSVDQKPEAINVGGQFIVQAVLTAECIEAQQRHSVYVSLEWEEETGKPHWLKQNERIVTDLPKPGKPLEISISSVNCTDGRWRVAFYVSGTAAGGERYRYPQKGLETKTSKIKCQVR